MSNGAVLKRSRSHSRKAIGGVPHKNPFVEMLQNTNVSDVIPDRKVLVLQSTNTVNEALQCLGKYKIQSAPVLNENSYLLGFVDVMDIVSLVVRIYDSPGTTPDSFAHKNLEFLSKPISEVIDMSTKNPTCSVLQCHSLFQCIGLFQKGLHRVAVVNSNGVIENILTQTDVIRFLVSKITDYPSLFDKTTTELTLGMEKGIISVHKSEKTIRALMLMNSKKVSAIAVVDDDGRIVGNLSASDLKGRGTTDYGDGADPFGTLQLPVLAFLQYGGMSIFPVGTCNKSTNFNFLLLKIMALRVHRLWVVNEDNQPVSIISLTDIMQSLIAQKQPDIKE